MKTIISTLVLLLVFSGCNSSSYEQQRELTEILSEQKKILRQLEQEKHTSEVQKERYQRNKSLNKKYQECINDKDLLEFLNWNKNELEEWCDDLGSIEAEAYYDGIDFPSIP